MMTMTKKDIIQALEKIAIYLEIKGENSFKVSAYRKAANILEKDERTIHEIDDVAKLPGIGKGLASVINELFITGQSTLLKELEEELPNGLINLLKIPGLGGKKIAKLYQELHITDVDSLRCACEQKKVQKLKGFGEKTEEKILAAITVFESRPERLPIAHAIPIAEVILDRLKEIKEIQRFEIAGSFRRGRETIKDLDFIISTNDPISVADQIIAMENVKKIIAHGETKVSLEFQFDDLIIPVDFRLIHDEAFITMLHHFTGSKDHNVLMRQRAKEKGEKISEYGVENVETGKVITFASESEFFNHFQLQFIPPEVREGKKELNIYEQDHELIESKMIRGDLHMHTTWSDGAHSLEEMICACRERGYEYLAITDHSKFLRVANGLTEERLKRQHEEIQRLNEQYDDIRILTGIEMDILPDGSLDFADSILKNVDFVIASIHSAFQQDEETIMKRLKVAMENPYVNMVAHPTGRVIGRREGYPVHIEALIQMAVETKTILELNANPNRLDLSAKWLELAQKAGVKIAINTDAHYIASLNHMEIGVKTARRGWLRPETVVNTWSAEEICRYKNS